MRGITLTGAITRVTTGSWAKSCPVSGTVAAACSVTGAKHVATFRTFLHHVHEALTENVKKEAQLMLVHVLVLELAAGSIFGPDIIGIQTIGNAIAIVVRRQVVEPVPVLVDELANTVAVTRARSLGHRPRIRILRQDTRGQQAAHSYQGDQKNVALHDFTSSPNSAAFISTMQGRLFCMMQCLFPESGPPILLCKSFYFNNLQPLQRQLSSRTGSGFAVLDEPWRKLFAENCEFLLVHSPLSPVFHLFSL
jgi:hypothetical protein